MTLIITGDRGTGKTALLLKHSAETGRHILVTNVLRLNGLMSQAKAMGLKIPIPITVEEFKNGNIKFVNNDIRRDGLLVDDMGDVVRKLFNNVEIIEFTIDKEEFRNDVMDLDSPRFDSEFRRHILGQFTCSCKDCKYFCYDGDGHYCSRSGGPIYLAVEPTNYCSFGVMKDEDHI
jgi:archaellum biogenesis ATPase FlaH